MRPPEPTSLEREFVEDHQRLHRNLVRTIEAVRAADRVGARQAAEELDRDAGPHIAFEEAVLYPQVAAAVGDAYADELYQEHGAGRAAIERLAGSQGTEPLSPGEQEGLLPELEALQEHILGCGSLLSHLCTLQPVQQERLLHHLLQFRNEGRRWSELPRRESGSGS
jgi:hypothetical protein